jgi:dihydrofolate synthase/folylpolyglutamate synthase
MNTLSYSSKNEKFCLELDRVRLLLEKAGNPDRDFGIIHIAGTNGKGSVCAFLEEGLTQAKIKCGRFSSPELFSVEDTITINKKSISKRCLQNLIKEIKPLCDETEKELGKAPSPFEILFVAALVYFKKKKCKKVILECGMGGIGDATNAILKSDIAVLTNIDLDHREYLGKNLVEITRNKCGILREGQKVFSALQNETSEYIIVEECKKKNCSLGFVPPLEICEMDFLNATVNLNPAKAKLSLAGVHQAQNASVAREVMRYLEIDEASITNALSNAVNRARLEKLSDKIYFDGAHNPAGVKALVKSINSAKFCGKIIFAIGFMADKDIKGCLDELKNLNNQNFEIYTATVFSNPRAETSENLALIAKKKGFKAKSFSNIYEAVKEAEKNADTVFAFGSLYMYKELLTYENR